ncbi:MAG: response regulator [Actinomycetia bacterium]|nr:response regulator [Actinomycetes bacterium]
MTKILVVDDEAQIRKSLTINLTARGYEVDVAVSGEEALAHAAARPPDLVLLDIGLPGIDGVAVVEGLRGWTSVPIIMLSVRDGEADKVRALDAGADDYVTKPFGMNEVLARLRAALRRHQPVPEQPKVSTSSFTIDLAEKHATLPGGEPVHLTPIEWEIVEALVRHPGRLVTQRQLLQQVWGPQYEHETNYLRVHLAAIRKKLEPEPSRPRFFLTEPGIGYRFEPDAAS